MNLISFTVVPLSSTVLGGEHCISCGRPHSTMVELRVEKAPTLIERHALCCGCAALLIESTARALR